MTAADWTRDMASPTMGVGTRVTDGGDKSEQRRICRRRFGHSRRRRQRRRDSIGRASHCPAGVSADGRRGPGPCVLAPDSSNSTTRSPDGMRDAGSAFTPPSRERTHGFTAIRVDGITSTVISPRDRLLGASSSLVPAFLDGYGLQRRDFFGGSCGGRAHHSVDAASRGRSCAARPRHGGIDHHDHHEPKMSGRRHSRIIRNATTRLPDKESGGVGVRSRCAGPAARLRAVARPSPHLVKIAAWHEGLVARSLGRTRQARLGPQPTGGPHPRDRALLEECGTRRKTLDSFHVGLCGARNQRPGRRDPRFALDLL